MIEFLLKQKLISAVFQPEFDVSGKVKSQPKFLVMQSSQIVESKLIEMCVSVTIGY